MQRIEDGSYYISSFDLSDMTVLMIDLLDNWKEFYYRAKLKETINQILNEIKKFSDNHSVIIVFNLEKCERIGPDLDLFLLHIKKNKYLFYFLFDEEKITKLKNNISDFEDTIKIIESLDDLKNIKPGEKWGNRSIQERFENEERNKKIIFEKSLLSKYIKDISIKNSTDDIYNITKNDVIEAVSIKITETLKKTIEESIDTNFYQLIEKIIKDKIRENEISTISSLSYLMEAKDDYTPGHQQRVSLISIEIAKNIFRLDHKLETVLYYIKIAALLHDIGKITLPEAMLKNKKLKPKEVIKYIHPHPMIGYNHIIKSKLFGDHNEIIAKIILQHHERVDGTGYPNGISGKNICLEACIISVADTIEAMSFPRSYRPFAETPGLTKALETIKNYNHYEKQVVDTCIDLFNSNKINLQGMKM